MKPTLPGRTIRYQPRVKRAKRLTYIGVRVDDVTKAAVQAAAVQNGCSVSAVIGAAMRSYLSGAV